jgi:hypothetical protein
LRQQTEAIQASSGADGQVIYYLTKLIYMELSVGCISQVSCCPDFAARSCKSVPISDQLLSCSQMQATIIGDRSRQCQRKDGGRPGDYLDFSELWRFVCSVAQLEIFLNCNISTQMTI